MYKILRNVMFLILIAIPLTAVYIPNDRSYIPNDRDAVLNPGVSPQQDRLYRGRSYGQSYYSPNYNYGPSYYGQPNYWGGYYPYGVFGSPPPPTPNQAFPDDAESNALYHYLQDR